MIAIIGWVSSAYFCLARQRFMTCCASPSETRQLHSGLAVPSTLAASESSGLRRCGICRLLFSVVPLRNQLYGSDLFSSSDALLNTSASSALDRRRFSPSCLHRWPSSPCHACRCLCSWDMDGQQTTSQVNHTGDLSVCDRHPTDKRGRVNADVAGVRACIC